MKIKEMNEQMLMEHRKKKLDTLKLNINNHFQRYQSEGCSVAFVSHAVEMNLKTSSCDFPPLLFNEI